MQTTYFATGTGSAAAATPANSGPGRLLGIQVHVAATTTTLIYDSQTVTSTAGLTLFGSLATVAAGTFVQIGPPGVGIPYQNGLWVAQSSGGPVMSVVFSPNCPNDGRPAT
jgi:hypothetical protein